MIPKHWTPPVDMTTFQGIFHKASLFKQDALRPAALNDFKGLEELQDLTGENIQDLAIFSPARMLLQETIIACDSRLYIEDDHHDVEAYADNFREIFEIIYNRYVLPKAPAIQAALDAQFASVEKDVKGDVAQLLASDNPELQLLSWFSASYDNGGYEETAFQRENRAKANALDTYYKLLLKKKINEQRSPAEFAALLERLVLVKTYSLKARDYLLGEIKTCIKEAIADQEVTALIRVPTKDAMLHIIHGPAAAGKTTLRPRIMQAAKNQGISWANVMVLNPDVWREFLLEGKETGAHADYWGPLTDNELTLMWERMDVLLRRKYHLQPHIMADHFYPDRSELYTYPDRTNHFHVSLVMAHPDQVVTRSYERGLTEGRFMTIPALLYTMSETYKAFGPYFRTAAGENVRIEIVDNAVPKSLEPKTIAFGDLSKDELNIFDVAGILLIDRYRQANLDAAAPDQLFDAKTKDLANNMGLLHELLDANLTLKFVDGHRMIYAAYSKKDGLVIYNENYYNARLLDPYHMAAFDVLKTLAAKGKGVHIATGQPIAAATAGMIGAPSQDCYARSLG